MRKCLSVGVALALVYVELAHAGLIGGKTDVVPWELFPNQDRILTPETAADSNDPLALRPFLTAKFGPKDIPMSLKERVKQLKGSFYFCRVHIADTFAVTRYREGDGYQGDQHPSLVTIVLYQKKMTRDDVKSVLVEIKKSGLPVFLTLKLQSKLPARVLKDIADADCLVGLEYSNRNMTNEHLKLVSKLTRLRFLSLYSPQFTCEGYQHLAQLVHLEHIQLRDPREYKSLVLNDQALVHMTKLTKIKYLLIGTKNLTEKGLKCLKHFPNLECLHFKEASHLGPDSLKHLATLTKLEALCFARLPLQKGEDLAHLVKLGELRYLEILNTSIESKAARHLLPFGKLHHLSLGNTGISDDALKHISNLSSLERLSLFEEPISDRGITYLRPMKNLSELCLEKTGITDHALTTLARMPNLVELDLSRTAVTDAGVWNLVTLKNLKALGLRETKTTKTGRDYLRKAIPNLGTTGIAD